MPSGRAASRTRSTTNTRRCAIDWATILPRTLFRSTRSTASLRPYIADGPRLNPPEASAQVAAVPRLRALAERTHVCPLIRFAVGGGDYCCNYRYLAALITKV